MLVKELNNKRDKDTLDGLLAEIESLSKIVELLYIGNELEIGGFKICCDGEGNIYIKGTKSYSDKEGTEDCVIRFLTLSEFLDYVLTYKEDVSTILNSLEYKSELGFSKIKNK